MKELAVISGKGGTGKTSLTAAFCSLAENMVLCDADVDAADLHLLMAPDIKKRTDFQGGSVADINLKKCTGCGICKEMCRFDAINDSYAVDSIDCEGCGVCVDFCPELAIHFLEKICGEWFISETRYGTMVHARLGIGEENSGRLVALVRQEARKIAEEENIGLIVTDGPPGIGCPVIASIGGADAVLIVAEPTVSGLHDMERVAALAAHFKVPTMLCVNKFDLNMEQTKEIEQLAERMKVEVIGRIPFDMIFTKSMIQGKTIFEYNNTSTAGKIVKEIWGKIMGSLPMNNISYSF